METKHNTQTDDFDFETLTNGDEVTVEVTATGGDLKDDEMWTDTLEYVGEQSLKAQSRKISHEFVHAETGKTVYLRFSAEHKNNFGFVMSERDQSEVRYDAMWQDPIADDREWFVTTISV
jgi:hypothetical protein